MPLGYIEYKPISSKGLKITIGKNSESCIIIDIFGNNSNKCGKCTIFASYGSQTYNYSGQTPIHYLKKVTNTDSVDLYLFHSGMFLSYGVLLNGNSNRDTNISIINSESEIPSNATTISPL